MRFKTCSTMGKNKYIETPEKKKDKIKRLEKEIEGLRIALNNQRLKTEEITRKLMLEITDKIFKKYTV